MAINRYYSAIAQDTTLSAPATNSATSLTVSATTGFPTSYPYILAVDYGASAEELVNVTAAAGLTLTVTRAFNGSSAVAHSTGAVVRHVIVAQDMSELQAHINSQTLSTTGAYTSGAHGITGAFVGTTDTQTLTNKTISGSSNTLSSIANSSLTNSSVTVGSTAIALGATGATVAGLTLTSPTVNSPSIKSPREVTTVSATAATGTINFDAVTQGTLYYTTSASANWTLNVRGDGSTTLNSLMATGESITVVFLATQGSTAYYASAFTIDGSSITPKWQGGTAPSAGNTSSVDAYSYTIFKTGSATYTVFASQVKFA